jgi:putative peptide zinc metalloprotease protein
MKPRLRSHVGITRQHYRGRRWHVVSDPTSNQFYRLNPIAYDLVMMLDGSRDVESVWKVSLEKFGDSAPTQNEVIQLLSQLYNSNLLSADAAPETEQLLRRGRERTQKRATAQAIGIMYLKIRLFNPDRLISAVEPILRPALNIVGFLMWLVLVVWAIAALLPYWDRLVAGFDNVMSPSNLWMIPVVFIITKAWHELGHGVICKRFGGQVPEFGVMLLVLFPSPYVDASAAWQFKSKWQRTAVGAGGMMFELFLAAIAAFVWIWAQDTGRSGEVVSQLMYNVMLTAGFSTVLFNANPLMRFDGYYMLADLLETPNLAQRSNKQLTHYFQKFVYRLENLTPPTQLSGERAILTIYGVLAFAYRIFLFITITLFVMGEFFGLGLVLAIWTSAAWFLMPVGKFVHWHATSPKHAEHRLRGILISTALIALILGIVGLVPLPDRRFGTGVIASSSRAGVYAQTEGFVVQVHKRPGERVEKDEPILTMESTDLTQRRLSTAAQIEQAAAQERQARRDGDPAVAQLAAQRQIVLSDNLKQIERRITELVVRAPKTGVIVTGDPERLLGAFARRGDPICEIVDPASVRVDATMDQRQAWWLFERSSRVMPPEATSNTSTDQLASDQPRPARVGEFDVEMKLVSSVDATVPGKRVEIIDAGQTRLPSPALGFKGGGQVEIDSEDESGREAKRPQFALRVHASDPADLAKLGAPGERVLLRFKLEPKPLLAQWLERLRKEIQGRVNI